MERDALIIRNLALDVVKDMQCLPCGYDLSEQIQRAGTALHLLFSELFEAKDTKEARALVESALRVAKEFRELAKHVEVPVVDKEKMELLVFTLRTYRSGGGKFRKFAPHNKGGVK
jgi:hypothetical protein